MDYNLCGRKPPKRSLSSGVFDENLRFIGSRWQFIQLIALSFAIAGASYVCILALLMVAG